MPLLNKNDLQYKYFWSATTGDNPRLTGKPDDVLLNRSEGYEVLAFINHMASVGTWTDKAMGLKAERLIKAAVPSNLHSRAHIWDWICTNWDKYQ